MLKDTWIAATLVCIGIAAPAASAGVIYDYIGSAFTACTYGPCPANYTSDYIIASISFAAPLTPSLPLTNEYAAVTAWTIGDALGNFAYSSSNQSTAAYLTGLPAKGIPALALSTDMNGNIVDYDMSAFPAEVLGVVGAAEAGLFNPPVVAPNGETIASFVDIDYGTSAEWDAISSTPGRWTETPEPSSVLLTSFSGAILIIAIGRKQRTTPANQTTV